MTDSKRPRIPHGLKQDGLAIWSYGFRPFFLGGAVWAVLTMILWILALAKGLPLGGDCAQGFAHWAARRHTKKAGFEHCSKPALMLGRITLLGKSP